LLELLAAGGRVASAFELAERRRARELMDALLQAEALRTGAKADAKSLQALRAGPVTADAIAASLPDESTALLEFHRRQPGWSGDRCSSSTAPACTVHRLETPKALSTQVARFAALLEGGTDGGELASTLGEALLQPALAGLGPKVTRLVIVPERSVATAYLGTPSASRMAGTSSSIIR
jgi:hypothetical protein